MTPLQQKVYQFIQQYLETHAYSPSLAEIATGIGISPSSISLISRTIHALVDAGQLRFHKKGYRNLQLAESQEAGLPLLGRIAAGAPIEAIEQKQTINLSALFPASDHFVLEVKGDSMIEEGIQDGDLVICRRTQGADEGQIIVALIDQYEATLKRVSYKIAERITLIPANAALKPKAYLPHRIQVQGVFVGLLRLESLSRWR